MDTNSTPENDIPLVFGNMGSGKKSYFGRLGLKQLLRASSIDWHEYWKQREEWDKTLREFLERKKGA